MHTILLLLFGLVVGAVARWLVPGKETGGWAISIVFGVLGSFLGSYFGQVLGLYAAGQPAGFVMSVLGAMALVFGYRAFRKGGAVGQPRG